MQAVHHCAAAQPWTVLAYCSCSSSKLGHRSRASTNSRAPIAFRSVDHDARRSPRKNLLHVACNLQENVPESAPGREVVKLKFALQKKCEFGQQFSVVGDHELLGSWDPDAAILMEWSEGHVWTAEVELPVEERVEFKVILKDDEGVVEWQPGPNVVLETSQALAPSAVLVSWSSEESMQEAVPLAQVVELNTLLDNNELKEGITSDDVLPGKIDEVGDVAGTTLAIVPEMVDDAIEVEDTTLPCVSEMHDDEESMQEAVPLAQVVEMNTLLGNNELKEGIISDAVLPGKIDEVGDVVGTTIAIVPEMVDDAIEVENTTLPSVSEMPDDVVLSKEAGEQVEVPMVLSENSEIDSVKDIPEAQILSNVSSTQTGCDELQTANKTVDKEVASAKLTEPTESAMATQDGASKNPLPNVVGLDIQQENNLGTEIGNVKTVVNLINGQRVVDESGDEVVNGTQNFHQTLIDPGRPSSAENKAAMLEEPEELPMNNRESEINTEARMPDGHTESLRNVPEDSEVLEDDTADVSIDTVIERDSSGWGRSTLSSLWAALLQRRKKMI